MLTWFQLFSAWLGILFFGTFMGSVSKNKAINLIGSAIVIISITIFLALLLAIPFKVIF